MILPSLGKKHITQFATVEKKNGYYKNIADHLLADVPLIITPEWAKGTIQCIAGCEMAASENRVVEVEFDF